MRDKFINMKPILTTIFTLILILTFCSRLHAQKSDTAKVETILKSENPYRKNQTRWLNSNGFNTSSYDWSDPAINLYLNQAVRSRSTGNVIGFVGGAVVLLGLTANFFGSVFHEDNDPGEEYQIMKGPYYLGGAMVATSIGLNIRAHSKLKKARIALSKK